MKCIKPPSCLWEFKKVNVSCLLVCFLNGWKRQSMMGSRWGRARPSDRKSSTQSLHSSLIMNAYGCLMRGKRRCLNSFGFRPFKPLPCSFPISQTLFPPSRPVSLLSLSSQNLCTHPRPLDCVPPVLPRQARVSTALWTPFFTVRLMWVSGIKSLAKLERNDD